MKRISGGICGYSSGSLRCSGIAGLDEVFYSSATCLWHSGGITSGGYSHNNYFALPQQAESMLMSVAYYPKFSGGNMAFLEECTSGGSFIYKQILTGGVTLYSGDTICTAASRESYDAGDRVILAPTNNPQLPCFTSGSGILQPGILEPMITVNMPAVPTQYITGLDSVIDGIIITLKGLNVWRAYVDASLKAAKNVVGGFDLKKIRPLADGMEENSCSGFRIYKGNGQLIACKNSETPTFGVMSGTVLVNSTAVTVSALPTSAYSSYPVNFYLDVNTDNNTAEITRARVSSDGHRVYHIGGVTATSNGQTQGCTIYNIYQAQCEFEISDNNGSLFIGVVTTAPTSGFGYGGVTPITVNTNGVYTTSGSEIQVVFPKLYG